MVRSTSHGPEGAVLEDSLGGSKGSREPQYNYMVELRDSAGPAQLGLVGTAVLHDDPRRLVFMLSRYKFVSKMFDGFDRVLEVGCGDATGTQIVRQVVPNVVATDFDPLFIADAESRNCPPWSLDLRVHDFLAGPIAEAFEGAYALDVLEHIAPANEDLFLTNFVASLAVSGAAIFGMPSLESQQYASSASREGHVNCKTGAQLRAALLRYFNQVFVFSMNDEVVHTGFTPMAHYLLALCTGPRHIDTGSRLGGSSNSER